jgi:hypothetical protein
MKPSLWFCVPVCGRVRLTGICLRQLRRTCDSLTENGVHATAVIVGDDENLDTATELGFATVERENRYLSRKFNDAIQLACDPRHNPRPANYVVPFGSDDWIDYRILLDLPPANTMVGFPRLAVVREDGRELTTRTIDTPGGSGIRIYPWALMAALDFRPGDEDRHRACDTSIITNLRMHHGDNMRIRHHHIHEHQIVDWKSPNEQLNTYESLRVFRGSAGADPFETLADTYPAEALEEMREHYAQQTAMVAA